MHIPGTNMQWAKCLFLYFLFHYYYFFAFVTPSLVSHVLVAWSASNVFAPFLCNLLLCARAYELTVSY